MTDATTEDYTPTIKDIRDDYTQFGEIGMADFDRGIAAHDAEVATAARRAGMEEAARIARGVTEIPMHDAWGDFIADRILANVDQKEN